ncbi:MAG: diacylglycerol kinase family lipid kinase, partial [Chloroflexi bacterium]|nr:diacylglycerol kinase family lipid kinase [Chloroflexota bacterium]
MGNPSSGESVTHLIINPAASNGRLGQRWPQLRALLDQSSLPFTYEQTERPGHATELARAARLRGVETVVAVGGDGTVHEVVNGLVDDRTLSRPADERPTTLGVIPFGTGSDLVRTLGIPRDPQAAVQRLIQGQRRLIDLGLVTFRNGTDHAQRYFVNVVGFGFDAAVTEHINRSSKALGG